MTDSCRVRAHLLNCVETADFTEGELAALEGFGDVSDCSGPWLPCLLGVTKEQVEKAAPHGVVRLHGEGWKPSRSTHTLITDYLSLPDILHRLSTQECPECDGFGRLDVRVRGGGEWTVDPNKSEPCPTCHGEERTGTVCESHLKLVTPQRPRHRHMSDAYGARGCRACAGFVSPPQLDPATIAPTDENRALLDSLGLETEAPS